MMRKIIFGLIILVVIFTGCKSKSYDFSAVCESGQTLYYKITSNEEPYTVDIVRQNINDPYYDSNPIGNLVIPETVLYNGITYSVMEIGNNAFSNSSNLASVSLPKTLTSIGDSAFYMCSGIREIIIPNSVTYVGRKAFYGCDSIESVALLYSDPDCLYPERLYSFKEDKKKCSYYWAYDYGYRSQGSTIGMLNSIFTREPTQYKLVISNDITSIPDYAFYDCSIFSSVEIPNSVTCIGNCAFERCLYLKSFSIPTSVKNIGKDAFLMTGWYYEQSDSDIMYLDNWCLGYKRGEPTGTLTIRDGTKCIADDAFCCKWHDDWNSLKSLIVPNSVKYIGKCAFEGCKGLTSVSIGESVEIIDSSAFKNCNSLKSLIVPNSVRYIGNHAFAGCERLSSVSIGESVEIIDDYAFFWCKGLKALVIPNSVTSIGVAAFSECSGLKTINVDSHNPVYDSREDCNAIIETYTNKLLTGCSNTVIPNSVTSIGAGAFWGHFGFTSINIPNSVISIGSSAFRNCSGLTSVTIPNSVTSIGIAAFSCCRGLTSVSIPNSIISIGDCAFENCSGLYNS